MSTPKLEFLDPFEAAFLQLEVKEYLDHGVQLRPGDMVLDVGANIGAFSAEVGQRLQGDVQILAFEPVPPICEVLRRNATEVIDARIEVFEFGLGAREESVEFTFFPLMSCLSSAHRDLDDLETERQRVAASLLEVIRSGAVMPHLAMMPAEMLEGFVDSYVKGRMRGERHDLRVRPLSAVLDEQGVAQVHLLKVDVEGAEEDVLAGIEDRHWPQIAQVVLELERFTERHEAVRGRLSELGYEVEAVQGEAQIAGDYGLLYALR